MTKTRSSYYHMDIDFHVYMPTTYIVEVIWECCQLQAKYEQNGIIFNCLGTRAVHVDISPDYSTEKFLMALRRSRFVSIRGYPSKIYADNGSHLVAASEELNKMVKNLDQKSLQEYRCVERFQWVISSADAPWQNDVSETLIKSTKRAKTAAICEFTNCVL